MAVQPSKHSLLPTEAASSNSVTKVSSGVQISLVMFILGAIAYLFSKEPPSEGKERVYQEQTDLPNIEREFQEANQDLLKVMGQFREVMGKLASAYEKYARMPSKG